MASWKYIVTTESDDSVTLLCLPTAAIAKQVTAINLPSPPIFFSVFTLACTLKEYSVGTLGSLWDYMYLDPSFSKHFVIKCVKGKDCILVSCKLSTYISYADISHGHKLPLRN